MCLSKFTVIANDRFGKMYQSNFPPNKNLNIENQLYRTKNTPVRWVLDQLIGTIRGLAAI